MDPNNMVCQMFKEIGKLEVKMDEMKKENEDRIAKMKEGMAQMKDEMKASINELKEGMAKLKDGIVGKNAAELAFLREFYERKRQNARAQNARYRARKAANGGQSGEGTKKSGKK